MTDAISDTGPIRHLAEIAQLDSLHVFEHISIPDLVATELDVALIDIKPFRGKNWLVITRVPVTDIRRVLSQHREAHIQPADAQVFVLAEESQFRLPVLTDDLALRLLLERHNTTVVGSIGILVRSYKSGRLDREGLTRAAEALLTKSSLYASREFRAYVAKLLDELL